MRSAARAASSTTSTTTPPPNNTTNRAALSLRRAPSAATAAETIRFLSQKMRLVTPVKRKDRSSAKKNSFPWRRIQSSQRKNQGEPCVKKDIRCHLY